MKLSYVKLRGTLQMKNPETGRLGPIFSGDDLAMSYEDGIVTVLGRKTGQHFSLPRESVEHMQRAEWPLAMRENVQQGRR